MPATYDLLTVARVTRMMQVLQDTRELPQPLLFLNRTAVNTATDGEIFVRMLGYAQIADLIADDEKGVTYSSGQLRPLTTVIPNIKHGEAMKQSDLNQLLAINSNPGLQDKSVFDNYVLRKLENLLLGIRQRWEMLLVAMCTDQGYSYNRLGIQMSGVTWGMPAELRATPSTAWTDNVNATPVSDILSMLSLARTKYGKIYRRITMSTVAWRYLISTTDFQNKAKLFMPVGVPASAIPMPQVGTSTYSYNLAKMIFFGEGVPGELEFYDSRAWQQQPDGTRSTSIPYLPINLVILSDPADDKNSQVMDLANAVVTESVVSSIARQNQGTIGYFSAPEYGPVSYVTTPGDLNPPTFTMWGVARSWPRKFDYTATACLKVAPDSGGGSMTDPVPVGAPSI